MLDRFRPSLKVAIVVVTVLLTAITAALAQTTYKAPRTPEGTPNLNGIWQAVNEAYWDVEAHAASPASVPALGAAGAIPPGLGIVEGGSLPYLPAAAEQRRTNFQNRLTLDPEIKCYLPGVPRANYMPYPFQILQTRTYIMMVYTFARAVRTIYMDDHQEAPADSWMGWSNGHWEGETLVVDTKGFNGHGVARPRRELPQRRAARGGALTRPRVPTTFCMKPPSKTRRCFPGPGRSACLSIAGSRRMRRSWTSGAWNSPKI